jgi:hypothetical protein
LNAKYKQKRQQQKEVLCFPSIGISDYTNWEGDTHEKKLSKKDCSLIHSSSHKWIQEPLPTRRNKEKLMTWIYKDSHSW